MKRVALLVLVVAVAALAAWLAGGGPAPERDEDSAPAGADAGAGPDAGAGAGAAGAAPAAEDARWVVLGPEGAPAAGARAEVFSVAPHRLEPVRRGEVTAGEDGGLRPDFATPEGERAVLVVRAPGEAPAVFRPDPGERELLLSFGRPIRGLVNDLHGRPIAGALVRSPREPPWLASATTGADGTFDLGVLAEDVTVRVEAEGYAPLDLGMTLFPLEVDAATITLPRGHTVAGRVVSARGEPVPGAVVALEQESLTRVVADGEGRFVFTGVLPDWEVLLTPYARGLVGETESASCGQRDVTLVLYRAASVEGTVVSGRTGFPVRDFEVRRHEVRRGEGGAFRIDGLPPGPLKLDVTSGSLRGTVSLDLAEGEARGDLKVPLFPPRWVPGDAVRAAWPVTIRTVSATTGEPAANVLVSHPESREQARTDGEGRLLVLLPAGTRKLVVGGVLEPEAPETIEVTVPRDSDVVARVAANQTATLDAGGAGADADGELWVRSGRDVVRHEVAAGRAVFPAAAGGAVDFWLALEDCLVVARHGVEIPPDGRLEVPVEAGATIRGRTLEPSGRPLAKVGIEVEDLPPQARVETAGDGLFVAGPVEPGPHRILVNARNVRTKRLVATVPPEGLDLGDLVMAGPADLRVRVVTTAGEPVPGAFVTTTFRVAAKGLTDAEGRITLPGTEPEESLKARAPGYLDEWVEIVVPETAKALDVTIELRRPARLLVRTVDAGGEPVAVRTPEREDFEAVPLGVGEVLLEGLAPGLLELPLAGEGGRTGTLRRIVTEGESGTATVVLE